MISWIIIICTAILILYKGFNGDSVEILYMIGVVGSVLASIFDPIWQEKRDKKETD